MKTQKLKCLDGAFALTASLTAAIAMMASAPVLAQQAPVAAAPAAAPSPPATGPTLDFRLRFESVDDDAIARRAEALTARLRIGQRWVFAPGWQLFGELEATESLLDDRFNSTANGRTNFPIVADPDASEINQAYVAYSGSRWSGILGRQRIQLDNQRFIGNGGWRQNEQTFDALALGHAFGKGLPSIRYFYLDKVHRVFGNQNPNPLLEEFDLSTHLLHVAQVVPGGTLTGYWYGIENKDVAAGSSRTAGLRWVGARPAEPVTFGWTVEFANQVDYADHPNDFSLGYLLIEPSLLWRGITFRTGVELMEGDGRVGFATPLATLHAQNGWAERFLVTPVDGIDRRYLGASGKFWNAAWTVTYYDFRAERGDRDYGDEFDAQLTYPFSPRLTGLLKTAIYDSNGFSSDETTYWASLEYKF